MIEYCYAAVDPGGAETSGTLRVSDQTEALRRIREMGLFPTRVEVAKRRTGQDKSMRPGTAIWPMAHGRWRGRIKNAPLAVFTRQLATLLEAGMPLLRGLRLLQEQAEERQTKRITAELAESIESGSSFTESLRQHPRSFGPLYVNMVHAGEISGAMEVTLLRLAEFMEKAQKIKGKIKAAMMYPCAVLIVAVGILTLLTLFVLPRFKTIFDGILNGASMPAFTVFVLKISELARTHILWGAALLTAVIVLFSLAIRTTVGRRLFDRFKLSSPVVGPLFRKAAISRFARTMGTLTCNGVPILQALTIVRETAGNMRVGDVIARVHEQVKQGEPIAPTLKASGVFPVMVAGMIDVGEQTGALPDMLLKIADTYDQEVENAANAMTSLLEPIMIVFLAVIVGSIVIAMFLPLLRLMDTGFDQGPEQGHRMD